MSAASPHAPGAPLPEPQKQLAGLREVVFQLHKTLIDSERVSYEQTIGTITSPNHFLQLLTQDPWFAWLQPLSRLIVTMDEALDANEAPLTRAAVQELVDQTRKLLMASENSEGFARHYYDALQRDPDVVMAHAAVTPWFKPGPPRS